MKVTKVENIDFDTLYKILTSNKITDIQKTSFVRKNKLGIKQIIQTELNYTDFNILMKNRPLQKFRPLKNSYTKWGDKIILAKSLGVSVAEIPTFVKEVAESMKNVNSIKSLSFDSMQQLKTYVYRHGTVDEIVAFFDYELSNAKDFLNILYKTLDYNTGGIADYFIRPIHKMNNNTLVRLFEVIDDNLTKNHKIGKISDAERDKVAKFSLVRIYEIQNNSKLLNALKAYNTLK